VVDTSGKGKMAGKGGRRMNTVQIMCTHVCKCKNDTCEKVQGIRRGWIKESSGGGEFKYNLFDTL
jgi:hypothetical protein